jgi:hypothetical protein
VPFTGVAAHYGDRFNRYADMLNITNGSLMLPDVGGTLYYSKLRIYDQAMLCDRVIARTVRSDRPAFYDYVFGKAKPTFIHTHGGWATLADFGGDSRFLRDYMPMSGKWQYRVEPGTGRKVYWGDFVRRDAVLGHPDAFEEIRAGYVRKGVRPTK